MGFDQKPSQLWPFFVRTRSRHPWVEKYICLLHCEHVESSGAEKQTNAQCSSDHVVYCRQWTFPCSASKLPPAAAPPTGVAPGSAVIELRAFVVCCAHRFTSVAHELN